MLFPNRSSTVSYTHLDVYKRQPYLWEGIYNSGEDTGPSYEIPGEALDLSLIHI